MARTFDRAPWVSSLRTLRFHDFPATGQGALAKLAASPHLSGLRHLELGRAELDAGPLAGALAHGAWPELERLGGWPMFAEPQAWAWLSKSGALPALRELTANLSALEPKDLYDTFGQGRFGELERLGVMTTHGDSLVYNLSGHHRPWRALQLWVQRPLPQDLYLLGKSPAFEQLEELTLSHASLYANDALRFLCTGALRRLDALTLAATEMPTQTWTLLLEHGQLPALKHLDLSMVEGVDFDRHDMPGLIATSELAPGLETLWLDGLRLSPQVLETWLGCAPGLLSLSLSEVLSSKPLQQAALKALQACEGARAPGLILQSLLVDAARRAHSGAVAAVFARAAAAPHTPRLGRLAVPAARLAAAPRGALARCFEPGPASAPSTRARRGARSAGAPGPAPQASRGAL